MKKSTIIFIIFALVILTLISYISLNNGVDNILSNQKYIENLSLNKNDRLIFLNGKKQKINNIKDYETLIVRAKRNKSDYLLRNLLNEKEYQYIKNAYFKKIVSKVEKFDKEKEDLKKQRQTILAQVKNDFNNGKFTQDEYKAFLLDINKDYTKALDKINNQERFIKDRKPYLSRFELINLINNYDSSKVNTKNDYNIRSLSLTQIINSKQPIYTYYDELFLNIDKALKSNKTITLKDLFPKYKKELKLLKELEQLKKEATSTRELNTLINQITSIKMHGK